MIKTKLLRGRRMLSSILIVIALYYSAPNIFSHDRLSANRLLSWILLYQIFIFFCSAITISFLLRFLSIRYSQKVSNYISSLCWNDVLLIFSFVSILHTAFTLTLVNVESFTSQWIIKGINFDIMISIVDVLVITIYFSVFYKISQPKRLFNKMLKDLNNFLKADEKEKINNQLLIIREFLHKAPLFLDSKLLFSILESPKAFQLLIENDKKWDDYFEEIMEMLFRNIENAISTDRSETFEEAIDFLEWFVDKVQDSMNDILEKLITGYYRLIFHNVQRLKAEQVLLIVSHLKSIFETLLKKEVNISDKSKSDLIGILDRLSYIIFLENSVKSKDLFSILDFYIILFAYFEKDYIFCSQVTEEFNAFAITLLQKERNISKRELRDELLKIVEKTKSDNVRFVIKAVVSIILLAVECKKYDLAYVLFNTIVDLPEIIRFTTENHYGFFNDVDADKRIFYFYKCLMSLKTGIKNENQKKRIYRKYLVAIGDCNPRKFEKKTMFKRLSGRK